MAKAKTITHRRPVAEPSGDTARNEIALHAAGAVDSLLKMLRREVDADAEGISEVLSNTLIRLESLNAVSLSVLSGNDRDIDEMCVTVYGQHSDGRLAHAWRAAEQGQAPGRRLRSQGSNGRRERVRLAP